MAIDGTWDLKLQTPMGERPVTVRLDSTDGALGGSMASTTGETPILPGGITDGTTATWSVMFSGAMGEMKLDFEGALDGDALSGTVQFGGFGTGTFEGAKA